MSENKKMIVGSVERCHLPEFGIHNLEVRIDTGAKTSSLHVDNIQRIGGNSDESYITFDIHPDVYQIDYIVNCKSRLIKTSKVKSSNGKSEERYHIETELQLGGQAWLIRLTLTDRKNMTYRMLLGREGMSNKLLVDPSQEFLVSD